MSFEAHILEPRGDHEVPDTVGLYALPFAATIQNSGDRLQAMVDEAGFPFVVSDLNLQHKKVIFDMAAREANQPSGNAYRSMSLHRADFFAEQAERFGLATKLGMGDSLAVPAIQGMAQHADRPFDAVLLRDGWNLKPGKGNITKGMLRYVGYTVRDKAQEMKRHKPLDIPYDEWSDIEPTIVNETSTLEKMRNVADLMSSPETRANALSLAPQLGGLGVAMNVVLYQHGLSGSPEEAAEFMHDLHLASNAPILKTQLVPGWHSDLLDPKRGGQDITNTLELLDSM